MDEKVCPFCGQLIVCEEDVDPRRRCRCADAIRYAAAQEVLEDMETTLQELFGGNCNDYSKVFLPVSENELSGLHHVVVLVAAGKFTKASITLEDGSICTIKHDSVSRKVTVTK